MYVNIKQREIRIMNEEQKLLIDRFNIDHLSDILDEAEDEEPFVAQSMRDFSALIRPAQS